MIRSRSASSKRLVALSIDWVKAFHAAGDPPTVPATLNPVTSALVLLSGEIIKADALDIASILRPLRLLTSPEHFADQCALEFALAVLAPTDGQLEEAARPLADPSSSLRLWMFRNAWLVRHRLTPEAVAESLLANVENTLGYWELSLALCRAIHPSEELFWQTVAGYCALGMPNQYASRVAAAREQQGWERATTLVEYERQVRQFLIEWENDAIGPPASDSVH